MFTAASFLITEKCNLACKYCFESKDRKCEVPMSKDVAAAGLEFLFSNAIKECSNKVDIMLFGGEPLLDPDLCEFILTRGYELQKKYDITFGCNLITNATIMNDKIELMLFRMASINKNFTCQLSIDGAKESQDLYRVFPDGRGSFDTLKHNISKYKSIFGARINFHGCVNKQSLPYLYDNYKFFADEWHAPSIWFMPVHTEDWSLEDVSEYDKQLGLIFSDLKRKGTMSYYAPIHKLLSCAPGSECHNDKTCGAGNSFCTITGNGDIYPCHNIYFNDPEKKTYCGNVLFGIAHPEVLKPFEVYTMSDLGCDKCANTKCYRCIADNYVHNGSITAQVGKPVRCMMSDVERKYQELARTYANKMLRPKQVQNDSLQKDIASINNNVRALTEILYNGLIRGDKDGTGQ